MSNKKEQELFDARMSGMLYAFNIAKEKGIEALEEEIKFRNVTKISIAMNTDYVKECMNAIASEIFEDAIIMFVSVLRDEYGFGAKRIQRIFDRIEFRSECIYENYVSWKEIADQMREELGINCEDLGKPKKEVRDGRN